MSDPFDLPDPIEGYCMRDRETVEIENPQAVWTRKGQPAVRGDCPICGGTVFRMGATYLHDDLDAPDPIVVGDAGTKRNGPKLSRDTVYINYAPADEAFAQQLAADLEKSGIATWLHDGDDDVNWSSGVHPALKECASMAYVLTPAALEDDAVIKAWEFFKDKRKLIVIAQLDNVAPPDRIRRSQRFDFEADYKASLRQVVRVIGRA